MKIGSRVYLAAKPDLPGVISSICDDGVYVVWVTNVISLVPPEQLRNFDAFIDAMEKVHTELYDRITSYKGHATALDVIRQMRGIPAGHEDVPERPPTP